ncbi:MAG: hypothetical protein IBJ07_07405 [Rhizobiaceae bacterium]|nr:hypothetical protein [Rhizobiaceae bacterium]
MRDNVRTLRRHLLPRRFRIAGNYDDEVFTGVVAFRVLCHGAIEEYFEERAIEIARLAHIGLRDHGRMSITAASLVAFSGVEMRLPPETIDPPQHNKASTWANEIEFREKVGACASRYIARLKGENHGVREKNLLSILIPIGVDQSKIDRLFLSEIDNFGKMRGEYAHSGVVKHVKKRPNPKDELDKMNKLIDMIKFVDQEFDHLLKNIA